ncbi:TolC family protein [Bartonella tamiae]|uniref:TolC family protein n=1 Tax=Bartonella tamiae TaxID=373638 RepID=UPI001FD9C0F5|nr:TolC family protein [Bartonella tamiae]
MFLLSATIISGCTPQKSRIVRHVPATQINGSGVNGTQENNTKKIRGQTKTVAIPGITLQNAVGVALARHPDIGRATAVVAQSNAQVAIEQSAWYPTLEYGVNPGYSRYGSNNTNNDNNDVNVTGTIGVNQLIYDFGRTSSRVGVARATYEKQQHLLNDTMEKVASEMASIFIELSGAQETIEAANREVAALTGTRDKISQRVRAGLSDVSDLNQADVAMQRAKADLLAAQTKYDVAAGRFAEMTGIRPQRVASLNDTTKFIENLRRSSDNIDDTPSVLAATAEVHAAEQRLNLAKANRFPSVSLGVSQSKASSNRNVANDSTFVGLQLSGRFSIGKREKYQIEASDAELRAAKQARDNDLMTTRTTLGSAETESSGAEARMSNAQEMIGLSLSSRDLYWQQYTLNKRPLTDVVNAERDTFIAESDFILAQTDRLTARIKAYTAVGQFVARIREGA